MGTLITRILVIDVLLPADCTVAFYDHIDDQKKNI